MPVEFRKDRHDAIIAQIEANPACWNQHSWHCGTTHCYAGLAQIASGKGPDDETVRRDARIWLGLTNSHADWLFDYDRSLQQLKTFVPGYDRDGYDRDGFNRNGFNRNGYNLYSYDRDGYNRDGYNRAGYNRDGYNRAGYDRAGYDREGYNCLSGFNRAGYDRNGYDSDGLNAENNPRPGVV